MEKDCMQINVMRNVPKLNFQNAKVWILLYFFIIIFFLLLYSFLSLYFFILKLGLNMVIPGETPLPPNHELPLRLQNFNVDSKADEDV